jgi:4-hydroxythreonine-4-phosphate dehydrogenase
MSSARPLPRIAITMGDPAGIGPEICLRALAEPRVTEVCVPVVFGDASILSRVAAHLGVDGPSRVISSDQWGRAGLGITTPAVLDLRAVRDPADVAPGRVGAATGRAAYAYIERSIDAALAGEVAAVVTGPIHKEALRAAGVPFPGHTEIYADRTKATRATSIAAPSHAFSISRSSASRITCHASTVVSSACVTRAGTIP